MAGDGKRSAEDMALLEIATVMVRIGEPEANA